jgi:hypothetical protein
MFPLRRNSSSLKQLPCKQIAVAGVETDVCILQSVLELLQMGNQVFTLEECLFTSEPSSASALCQMKQVVVIPCTLKPMVYELASCVDHTPWHPEGCAL